MNVAREKGEVALVCINTVTIVKKKFSEVYGVIRALYNSSRLFSIHADNIQQMENANW